jgi:hypothetical protein
MDFNTTVVKDTDFDKNTVVKIRFTETSLCLNSLKFHQEIPLAQIIGATHVEEPNESLMLSLDVMCCVKSSFLEQSADMITQHPTDYWMLFIAEYKKNDETGDIKSSKLRRILFKGGVHDATSTHCVEAIQKRLGYFKRDLIGI